MFVSLLCAGWLLVVVPVEDPDYPDLQAVLTLAGVAAQPHLHLGGVDHGVRVVPGHTVPGSQNKPGGTGREIENMYQTNMFHTQFNGYNN